MKRRLRLPVFLCALLIASISHAQDVQDDSSDFEDGLGRNPANADSEYVSGLGMQTPTYSGSGCPQGSVSALLTSDQRSLSVVFDSYIARAAGAQTQSVIDCQIVIPFQVPPRYQVQIVKLDYRGFTYVPRGARSTFAAGFRFLDENGRTPHGRRVMRAKVFAGPREENFTVSSELRGPDWSPCGKSFKLQAESRIQAHASATGEEVMTAIDSMDAIAQPAVYHLRWARCQDREQLPNTRPPHPRATQPPIVRRHPHPGRGNGPPKPPPRHGR